MVTLVTNILMRGEGRLLAGWRGGGRPAEFWLNRRLSVVSVVWSWRDPGRARESPHIIISLHQQQSILRRHQHNINTVISPNTNPCPLVTDREFLSFLKFRGRQ